MKNETVEEFLARGGKVTKIKSPKLDYNRSLWMWSGNYVFGTRKMDRSNLKKRKRRGKGYTSGR